MSAATVIRFPPPPPTRNELTSEQRAKLIRTNNKLGQVLGSTPHVLDFTYQVQRPVEQNHTPPKSPISMRNPFRTHGRSRSAPKVDVDSLRSGSPESFASTASNSSRKSSTSARRARALADLEQAWRSPYPADHPPLLRLAPPTSSRTPRLETIPGSPPFDHGQIESALEPPSFALQSEAALRREKMRRLQRRLGDNVPKDLVFPDSLQEIESDSEEDSPLLATPTSSVASRDWLLVDKPLPPVQSVEAAGPSGDQVREHRPRLSKERPKRKPSKGAVRLDSIVEDSAAGAENVPRGAVCVGVMASAGMEGKGRSRRFVHGPVPFDQVGGVWTNGTGIGW
ncbi:hypothetical protein BD413DRAFT_467250 [Trametes elegans]|nr:hypothetical protein BD413DRAFT_467250 [Trametes elegans]